MQYGRLHVKHLNSKLKGVVNVSRNLKLFVFKVEVSRQLRILELGVIMRPLDKNISTITYLDDEGYASHEHSNISSN